MMLEVGHKSLDNAPVVAVHADQAYMKKIEMIFLSHTSELEGYNRPFHHPHKKFLFPGRQKVLTNHRSPVVDGLD